MSILRQIFPLVLLTLAQTACSELKPYIDSGNVPVVSREYGIDYWLTELHKTRGMTPAELQQTFNIWELEFDSDPNAGNSIKLALLLTFSDAPVRDRKRARELLDGLGEIPMKTSHQELVVILQQVLDDQEQAHITISKLKKQAQKQSGRIQELELQLQALTDIEQNIQQRDNQPDIEQSNEQQNIPPDDNNGLQ